MPAPVYTSLANLALVGLNPALYEGNDAIDDTKIASLIALRSRFADDFLARFYKLPLTAWDGSSLTTAVSQLVAWDVMCIVGHNPENAGETVWSKRLDEAMATLERIAKHGAAGIVDSSTSNQESSIAMASEPRRGW